MNTNLFPSAVLAAILSLLVVNFASAPASAYTTFTMTIDELGNCITTFGTCSGVFEPDPLGRFTGNVLVYTLPEPTYTGAVRIFAPDGVTLSDALVVIDANNGFGCAGPSSGKAPCSDREIYYSLDDLGGQTYNFTAPAFIIENPDGSWIWTGSALGNTTPGVSDVPLPAALPLFVSGLVGLGLLGWRRKKAA
jgi:hypothetical protein